MEFGQIELNYFDWNFQNAKGKLELLQEWNIPVWVMEPVRGGQLAKLQPEDETRLKAARPEEKIPAWAFRFLQSLPVTVTLSGMTSLEQVKDNLATYQEAKPLNPQEMELILSVADDMIRRTTVPCTACHYCVSHCPKHLPIPDLLKLYNEAMVAGSGAFISSMGLASFPRSISRRPAWPAIAVKKFARSRFTFPMPWRILPGAWGGEPLPRTFD